MATGSEEIRAPIAVPVDTNADQAATSVDALADALAASKDKIRDTRDLLKGLRGKSDEVKAAKDQLKAVLDKENAAVSRNTLALLKQGKSLGSIQAKVKEAAAAKAKAEASQTARTKAMGSAVNAAGGPVASLTGKLGVLKDVLGGTGGGMGLVTLAAAGLVAGVVAVTAATVAGIASFAKWVLVTADAARSLNLVREASTGSAEQAKALGSQVDALAGKVGTSKESLNELAVSLRNGGMGGQQLVDTFNAVGQAAAAMGDTAGAKLKEIVERSRVSQRMFVNPLELRGTGLTFDDLAKEVGAGMKGGVAAARKALFEGRVPLSAGAKALADATQKKFGDINLRKMLSFDGLVETMRKKFSSLTSGVNMDRILTPLGKLVGMLDESTMTGHALKRIITAFGEGLTKAVERGAPLLEGFIKQLIIGGLQVYVTYLKVRNAFKGAFGDTSILKNVDAMGAGIKLAKAAVVGFAIAATALGAAVAVGFAPFAWAGKAVVDVFAGLFDLTTFIASIDWGKSATAMIDGLVNGLTGGASRVANAVGKIAEDVKTRFKDALGIRSPSKVFEDYGKNTTEGFARGVDDGSAGAQASVSSMVGAPSSGAGGGGKGGGAPVSISATLVIQGGSGNASATLDEPELLAKFTKLLQDAAASAGIGVPA